MRGVSVPSPPTTDRYGDLRALGEALTERCDDCCTRCEERREALGIADVGTADFRTRRRASQLLGVQLFARWLLTGEGATVEERNWLGGLGEQGAKTGVSITNLTRGQLIFRDVVGELIDEEAARLNTPRAVLDQVRRMNVASCDSGVLWMTRYFDAELVASQARFRSVFESMACGVLVVSPDGGITGCNDAAAAMLHVTPEAMIGTSVFDAGPNYQDETGAALERIPTAEAVETGKPVRGRVVKHVFGDGSPTRWHLVDAMPIFDEGGDLLQVVSSFVDVTGVRVAEELQEESAAKSRFLGTMSHELRTPLTAILGFTQLLRSQSAKLDQKQRRHLANIESSGKHLLALISDVLELSRAASGQLVVTLSEVDVAAVIEEVIGEFEPILAKQPVALRMEVEPGLRAMVDRGRFQQVLENLVSNALKFTEKGSVKVVAGRLQDWVEVRVTDTGIGIPADHLDRVFDGFTQIDDGTTRIRGGAGLGLPLSRRLVEMMGGLLTLESKLGEGTTAVVRLPLASG